MAFVAGPMANPYGLKLEAIDILLQQSMQCGKFNGLALTWIRGNFQVYCAVTFAEQLPETSRLIELIEFSPLTFRLVVLPIASRSAKSITQFGSKTLSHDDRLMSLNQG